jgi:hypothetical protein
VLQGSGARDQRKLCESLEVPVGEFSRRSCAADAAVEANRDLCPGVHRTSACGARARNWRRIIVSLDSREGGLQGYCGAAWHGGRGEDKQQGSDPAAAHPQPHRHGIMIFAACRDVRARA